MLKRITCQQFIKNLKTRKLEKIGVISEIEKILKKQRGYVFKMPRKGSSVILLLSGGLDSVTSWGILMKEYGFNVYPISFDRGEKRAFKEKASIDYFSEFYKKKFPKLYHHPVRLSFGLGNIKIPIEKSLEILHPNIILKYFKGDPRLTDINLALGSFLLLPVYAKIYAEYLYFTRNLDIKSIFCSVTLSDGQVVPHQTFTSLRTAMLYLCSTTGDYRWQFTSALFEKEEGLYLDKSDLVKWADENKIPLERTWSCYHCTKYQCGGTDCQTCIFRRLAFTEAKVKDRTIYLPVANQTLLKLAKYELKRFLGINDIV